MMFVGQDFNPKYRQNKYPIQRKYCKNSKFSIQRKFCKNSKFPIQVKYCKNSKVFNKMGMS